MEHPFRPLIQGVAAAVSQLCRQLHQQVLGAPLLYVGRHRAQTDRAAAEIAHLEARAFQQREIRKESRFLFRRKLDDQRLQQELAGDVAVVRSQLLEELALMGGVLVDDTDFIAPLREDIGAEKLPHIPQRLRAVLHIKAQLLGGRALLRRVRHIGQGRQRWAFRSHRGRLPRGHVVAGDVRQVDVRLHIQLGFAGRSPEGRRLKGAVLHRRLRAVEGGVHRQQCIGCNRCPAVLRLRSRRFRGFCGQREDVLLRGRGLCRAGHCRRRMAEGAFGRVRQASRLCLPRNDCGKPCKAVILYIYIFFRFVVF